MGRPGDEFWSLTYREIHACIDQYLEEREERLMLFGTQIATQINIATQGKTQHSWTDIFRSRKRKQQNAKVASLEEIRERWRKVFEVVGTNR